MRQRRITNCDRFRDYKVRQSWITNCDEFWITKCEKILKKWITNCDGITKRDGWQSDTVQHLGQRLSCTFFLEHNSDTYLSISENDPNNKTRIFPHCVLPYLCPNLFMLTTWKQQVLSNQRNANFSKHFNIFSRLWSQMNGVASSTKLQNSTLFEKKNGLFRQAFNNTGPRQPLREVAS